MVKILPPLPPERQAYALARYSRSADSIEDSLKWVYTHDEKAFLSNFAFSYGHASIKDLGHVVVCFEGISDLAAQHILGYDLIDAQCKSTRYQDFSSGECVLPPGTRATFSIRNRMLSAYSRSMYYYGEVLEQENRALRDQHQKPDHMDAATYRRTIGARALDVARYCLPTGIPTSLGIVCSIRTLEKIVRDALIDPYPEVQVIGREIVATCAEAPIERRFDPDSDCLAKEGAYLTSDDKPVLPTLASHLEPNTYLAGVRDRAAQFQGPYNHQPSLRVDRLEGPCGSVGLYRPTDGSTELLATLMWQQGQCRYDEYFDGFHPQNGEYLRYIVGTMGPHDELKEFRTGLPYQFEIEMDWGGFRDLRRHRRCVQFRQHLDLKHASCRLPPHPAHPESADRIAEAWKHADATACQVAEYDPWAAHYLLPMAHQVRVLFKMDFGEVHYLTRLRTGPKGHDSYRNIAWLMGELVKQCDPGLAPYIITTHPAEREPLIR